MPTPARNTVAVIGAGPIGLEAAVAAIDAGLDAHVFEQGEVGSHPLGWGHVEMFTPWRMNVGAHARVHLERAGWEAPDADTRPSGREFAERCLAPLARVPALANRVHANSQVVHVARRGLLQGDPAGSAARREQPFRLLVRDPGGRENFIHAFAVIDASGTYHRPNWAGDGGIPARGELYLAPQLAYHLPDVLGLQRALYAGRRTIVIGDGDSAATTITLLARLAGEVPGTSAVWATRCDANELLAAQANDPLPARSVLRAAARELARGASPAITHAGGVVVEGLEFNSATHRYRVNLRAGEQPRMEEVDQVVVHTGGAPDETLTRELRLNVDLVTRGTHALAVALDCGVALDAALLAHPEPDFYMLGVKAYGRHPGFLLEAGYREAAAVVQALAAAALAPTRA